MEKIYSSPNSYYLIYGYTIPGSVDHGGLIKVGDTSFSSPKKVSKLTPGCKELIAAAKARIDQQTSTAGIKYDLVFTELAVRTVEDHGVKYLAPFRDHNVHDVLENSGFKHVKFKGAKGREWYKIDLGILKKAVKATKEMRVSLNSSEFMAPADFKFRAEQEEAIGRTLTRFKKHYDMLWDAKMRFGKTPTALEVVLRGKYRRTIIVTHRPVVETSWHEDFQKIFPRSDIPYEFVTKFSAGSKGATSAKEEADKKDTLDKYDKTNKHFIYFASIQDLRGSKRMGGEYFKNDAVFDMQWDLIIIDEAHEGTQTELGKKVSEALKKKGHTRVLSLSGTPFNILGNYDEDAVFVWDYTMEQKTKLEWEENHLGEPNPYAVLPRMNIYTFDLSKELGQYDAEELEGKAFNFTEFFRTWTGDKDVDGKPIPAGAKIGDFIHADDVKKFLDLISTESNTSRYPFASQEYCDFFRHSLWMVPGVAAARALSAMLGSHKKFKSFGVANVAGEGDDYEETHYENALELVREKIKSYPRTITLSCGKLTTGVTVPEWTAVMMLSGNVHTAASSYMQTIFRVQSPWVHDGQCKEECYVFDFAPDRTLTVLTEAAQLSKRVSKDAAKEGAGRTALADFINYCPVISIDGGRAKPYDVNQMMRRLKHVFVMKAIRNGFDDVSIYNNEKLLKLGKLDLKKFNDLEKIVGKTKQTEAPNSVDVNTQGYDQAEFEKAKKEKEKRLKRKLTPAEEEALKKRREELQRARDARSILRAISIRMPLLIYGADVPVDESITIEKFVKMVDEESWNEFMPNGVTKKRFHDFIEYYDKDVFEAAGLEIRKLAKAAEKLSPGQRVRQIARIFSYFKNPDKETVLTPWRVVNMHLSDTLGGWCFYDKDFNQDSEKMPEEPRHVDRGAVTKKVFASDSKILEINSKSGLYPLYVAYSLYRARCGDLAEDEVTEGARIKKWREVLQDNVYVICKTPMAVSITRRTLAGYSGMTVNVMCYKGDLVETLKLSSEKFTKKILKGKFWGKKEIEDMKFDAVVGNPPYQSNLDSGRSLAKQLFPKFIELCIKINPLYWSLITPQKWFTADGQDNSFPKLRELIRADNHIQMIFSADGKKLFPNTELGVVSYYLWNSRHVGNVKFVEQGVVPSEMSRPLFEEGLDIILPQNKFVTIIKKVVRDGFVSLNTISTGRDAFGINGKGFENRSSDTFFKGAIKVQCAYEKMRYAKRSAVAQKGVAILDSYKVFTSKGNGGAGLLTDGKAVAILGKAYVAEPGTACTDSLIPFGKFNNRNQAENLQKYMGSKFLRFLVGILKVSQNLYQNVYSFVPLQDFTKNSDINWNKAIVEIDQQLYKKYQLTKEEIDFIESMIKPME